MVSQDLHPQASALRKQHMLEKALGPVRILSVGVSNYPANSGYSRLAACSNDANAVADCFADVRELNGARESIIRITHQSELRPTRGALLGAVRDFSASADADDRILFYYSGHGQRLEDEFYLVPEDVLSAEDPDTLIPLSRVLKTLNESEARQKIVLLDACLSGPDTRDLKVPLANTSPKFLAEYIEHTTGVAIIASSAVDQISWGRSPNPKASLFTYFLIQALRGEPEALVGGLLTLESLFQFLSVRVRQLSRDYGKVQAPTWTTSSVGTIVLADFNQPILPPPIDLEVAPIKLVEFDDERKGRVSDVLTAIKQPWKYSAEYLEEGVNSNLERYTEELFGRATAKLCSEFGFDPGQLTNEGSVLLFPAGSYWLSYQAKSLETGIFVHTVSFASDWFDHAVDIPRVLKLLGLFPEKMRFVLRNEMDFQATLPGLRAKGWQLSSITASKVEATQGGYRVTIKKESITFDGLTPQEILGTHTVGEQSKIVSGVLLLLGGP